MLVSQCLSYGTTTPYLSVLHLLCDACGIAPADSPDTRTARVTRTLQAVGMPPETWAPLLLHLLGVPAAMTLPTPLSPETRKARTLEALTQLCLQGSRQRPLLLVVEDLHWGDTASEEALAALIEAMAGAPIGLLMTYRPGYRLAWLDKSYTTQLVLRPLTRQDSQQVVEVVLASTTYAATLVSQILTAADGNPFFLEELAHTVVEQGPEALAASVPDTVEAVLRARLDRLPGPVRSLLQAAAVIGKDVPVPLWQALTTVPEATLAQALRQLQAAEFLYATPARDPSVYTFKHALTQEVAYGSLLPERRRRLHARLVEAIEALASDHVADEVDRLAYHALHGEVWDKAVSYAQQAGARAHERAAFREAVASFERALRALEPTSEAADTRELAIDLRLALGNALTTLGEYEQHLALLGEAEALARALDDRTRLGRVLARMTQGLRLTGDYDGAIAASQQVLALAVAIGDSTLELQASLYLGQAYHAIGDFGQAAGRLRWSVEMADAGSGMSRIRWRGYARAWLALTLSGLGAFAEGRRHGEEALRLATREGRGPIPIIARGCLGRLYLTQGDLERAIEVSEQGLALCRASGNRDWLGPIVASLGYAYALQGRIAEGHTLLEEAVRDSLHSGRQQGDAYRVAWLSEVCRLAGRREEAWQHAHRALDLARQHKERANEALALHQLGAVHAHTDPPEAAPAAAYYQQALTLATALGMRPLVAHCHLGLGTLHRRLGQWPAAHTALTTAMALYRELERPFWLARAKAELAHLAEEPC